MKVCWPSRSVASTSLSGSWRCREGRRRRRRWMRWWPRENGRCLMRISWMTPESRGRNYRRLSSDIRYDVLSKTGSVLEGFFFRIVQCDSSSMSAKNEIFHFLFISQPQAKSGYCCVDQYRSYFLWSRPFSPDNRSCWALRTAWRSSMTSSWTFSCWWTNKGSSSTTFRPTWKGRKTTWTQRMKNSN